ncbi:MAG: ABC transporter permease [Alphaproteobacteria bacterium]|nr:ABC transporter permease [Alphaproteobacteria bacterium]
MTAAIETERSGLVGYLTAEVSRSPTQASLQRLYFGCRRFAQNPLAMVGFFVLVALILIAVFAPWIAPFPMNEQNLQTRLLWPSADHLFGTDELGRDIFSRVVYGSRITLQITCLVAVIAAPIGLLVGTVSGYFGGWTDTIMMRLTDVFLSFPPLILALGFVAALGPGIRNAVIAIALTVWPPIARLARAETLTVRSSDYIAAIRAQGAPAWRVVVKHVMPMCLSSVIIRITLNMAGIILTAAALGFLGLGAQPPMPEWGAMLSTGRQYLLGSWFLAAAPGLAIVVVSLGFNLFGDGLRDVLDPRDE